MRTATAGLGIGLRRMCTVNGRLDPAWWYGEGKDELRWCRGVGGSNMRLFFFLEKQWKAKAEVTRPLVLQDPDSQVSINAI